MPERRRLVLLLEVVELMRERRMARCDESSGNMATPPATG